MKIRLMTYNILKGGEDRVLLIRDVIRAQAPDVVAVQEAERAGNTELLARELGMRVVYGEGDTRYSLAWLSRLPLLRSQTHRLAGMRKPLLEIAVELDGEPVRLFAAHLQPRISGEALRVVEVEAILEILRSADDQPHLLVGDFNTVHPDDAFVSDLSQLQRVHERVHEWVRLAYGAPRLVIPRLLAAGYGDCYRALHGEALEGQPGYTFATRLPMTRIDYIFASPQMAPRLRACDVVNRAEAVPASDHFPVVAQFA